MSLPKYTHPKDNIDRTKGDSSKPCQKDLSSPRRLNSSIKTNLLFAMT